MTFLLLAASLVTTSFLMSPVIENMLGKFFYLLYSWFHKNRNYLIITSLGQEQVSIIRTESSIKWPIQGLVKGAELCLNPYFFGWLEKWVGSLHVKNKNKDFWNKISLLLQDLDQCTYLFVCFEPHLPSKILVFFLNVTLILRNWDCFMTCDILAWQRENLLNVAWLLVTTCKCRWCCLLLSLVSHVSFIKSERSEQWSKQSHSNIFVKYYILHTFFT